MYDIENQQNEQQSTAKQVWKAPEIETCNIDQTMTTTGSAGDGGGSTP